LRSELEFAGDPAQPPGEARELLFAFLWDGALAPVAELKSRRRRWSLAGEGGVKLAELVDDRVQVLDGEKIRGRFREIEIEAESIDRKGLQRIANRMRKAGAKPEQRSKASRALEALHKLKPAAEPVSPGDPATAAVQPALAAALRRLLSFDPYARLGDPEGVHQLRVSARRLRSVLRTFAPIVRAEKTEPVIEDLHWLGQVLGDVRDLDVLDARLRSDTEPEEAGVLATALSSPRYVAFIERVMQLIADEELTVESPGACQEVLPSLVERMWKKLRQAGRALEPESAEADFHRARILAKRARYSAETVAVFLKPKAKQELEHFAQGAEAVQNILGEHQDAAFARTTLLQIAAECPDDQQLNASVWALVERQERDAKAKREEFFEEWPKLDRKKNTTWVR
jgi:CHAD domain-containing protein